jgi:hypothetical protein
MYLVGVHREMDECTLFETKDGSLRVAIFFVLLNRVIDVRPRHGIFKFSGSDWDAVNAQNGVNGALRVLGVVVELASDAQSVGLVSGLKVGVHTVHRAEVGDVEPASVALKAVAEGGEGAVVVEPLGEVGDDLFAGAVAEEIFELRPGVRLGVPDERERFGCEKSRVPVKLVARNDLVATVEKIVFKDGLERGLSVRERAHYELRSLQKMMSDGFRNHEDERRKSSRLSSAILTLKLFHLLFYRRSQSITIHVREPLEKTVDGLFPAVLQFRIVKSELPNSLLS